MIDIEQQPLFKVFSEHSDSLHSVIVCPDGQSYQYGNPSLHPPLVFYIKDFKLLSSFKQNSLSGLKESYLKGHWECNHISKILRLIDKTLTSCEQRVLKKFHHSPLHHSSLSKLSHDYNLFNSLPLEFFSAWLDPSLSHTIASFHSDKMDPLYIAQQKSIQYMLSTLEHHHIHTVLDTHAMWGSFSEKACIHHDITLTTLSQNHAKFCKSRFHSIAYPINYQITTSPIDPSSYLPFDAAVGILPPLVTTKDWNQYFHFLSDLIRPDGIVIVQLVFDSHFQPLRLKSILKKYNFSILENIHISQNASKTHLAWLNSLSAQYQRLEHLGFSPLFLRQWLYYFSEMAFYFNIDRLKARQMTLIKY